MTNSAVIDAGNKSKLDTRSWGLIVAAWIFSLEYSLYLVGGDFPDKLIKLSAALIMLLYFRYRPRAIASREKILLAIFITLLFTALVPSIFRGDAVTGVSQWMKIALMTTVLPFLLVNSRLQGANGEPLLAIYMWLGFAFSLQAILAFFALMGGIVDTTTSVEIGRRPGLVEATLGILGYANAIKSPLEGFRWLRPQGWFLEPSLLGAFLLLPCFVAIGKFLQCREIKFLILFCTVVVAMLLTVSLATFLGLIVGLSFLVLSKPFFLALSKVSRTLRYGYPILIGFVFLFVALSIIAYANLASDVKISDLEDNEAILTSLYARDPNGDSGNLFREVATLDLYVETILSNPIGVGLAQTLGENDLTAANGLLFWGVIGGLPALMTLVVFFGWVFFAFCHPLLVSNNAVFRCIGASFIGHAVQNLSYGNWLAPFFLIHLAIVCMTLRQARCAAS